MYTKPPNLAKNRRKVVRFYENIQQIYADSEFVGNKLVVSYRQTTSLLTGNFHSLGTFSPVFRCYFGCYIL